ncbi:MAG: NAD(+) synthase [Candidatus Electrothrix sp. ATG2]|nr:NAD(+) synthase [Candidatus Electrothrix sp. ATG2]
MIVLINQFAASASEIFAGAMQDQYKQVQPVERGVPGEDLLASQQEMQQAENALTMFLKNNGLLVVGKNKHEIIGQYQKKKQMLSEVRENMHKQAGRLHALKEQSIRFFNFDVAELGAHGIGKAEKTLPQDAVTQVDKALVLGLRDYLHKTGFQQAVIGLSGGIDSAVTAVLAAAALGPENVLCVALPSPYTAQMSIDDAAELAKNLGCAFELLPIAPAMEAYSTMLAPLFAGREEDVTEQNLQARIRGNLLMALSNKFGSLLLTTGNKSEMAVGYCTLYGDMSGGLAVLADVPKVMVYELARWMNRAGEVIPERIITRPPSAELKPDQEDQDDLPPYEVLDPILSAYLEEHLGVEEITARGYEQAVVKDIVRRIRINEHKRKQAPLGLKVTSKAFGYGRRYPIVHGFME